MVLIGVKYAMHDLICEVIISYCAFRFAMGKY